METAAPTALAAIQTDTSPPTISSVPQKIENMAQPEYGR